MLWKKVKLGKRGRVRRWYLTCWRKLAPFSKRIFLQGKGWRGKFFAQFSLWVLSPLTPLQEMYDTYFISLHTLYQLGKMRMQFWFQSSRRFLWIDPSASHLLPLWAVSSQFCLMKCSSLYSEGLLPPGHNTFPPDHSRGSCAQAGTGTTFRLPTAHRGLPGLPPQEPKAALSVALIV